MRGSVVHLYLILAYCCGHGRYARSTLMGTLTLVPAAVAQPHVIVRVRGRGFLKYGHSCERGVQFQRYYCLKSLPSASFGEA